MFKKIIKVNLPCRIKGNEKTKQEQFLSNITTVDIRKLTLDTPIYHYHYGKGKINNISNNSIHVKFKFGEKDIHEHFTTLDTSNSFMDSSRHISELKLTNDF